METNPIFTPFVDQLTAVLPEGPLSQELNQELKTELTQEYQNIVESGLESHAAFHQTLFHFGAAEALEAMLLNHKLLYAYQRFQRRYPIMLRWGFLGLIVMPLLSLVLMFSLNAKITALICLIVSVIAFAVFLICIEYTNYHYHKLMEQNSRQRIQKISGALLDKLVDIEKIKTGSKQ